MQQMPYWLTWRFHHTVAPAQQKSRMKQLSPAQNWLETQDGLGSVV
jgi:hypothetical protein